MVCRQTSGFKKCAAFFFLFLGCAGRITDATFDAASTADASFDAGRSAFASPEPIYNQIVYVSTAVVPDVPEYELQNIILASQRRNMIHDVTGLLLYKDGTFAQIIEGPHAAISHIFHLIEHDPRHKDIHRLLNRNVTQRDFPGWNVAFRNLAYTQQMNAWADEQNADLTAEELDVYENALCLHEDEQMVSPVISRLIALYQRLLRIDFDDHRRPNIWSRANRIRSTEHVMQTEPHNNMPD